ncbi:MAG: 2-oxo acid dehydrogenase subunit E2 [Chloroflexi bacterium]|nr:2-oxo acid dehydrogenase subunit E2 [Chloroflexi bacterium CFX1]MCK6569018.1 2-oxo acid dehydrogenase subunit E2 [Anaerolineales bacterium]MCQ3953762.1 2-oxo acid dehydrogenase subunit E2 [Chloroflexota bacterium]MDL1918602.1 2-oxo acid dehydrogenase subunit E2 [Chloroflexi bacterium CFX5]NUQ59892.1 2-oxo acid dehydrogenase subunit E2 [Anaerolineales bacterium]
MTTKVLVPRLGEGVDEVTVTKWLKQEGDSIKELEPLLEVNTDKVDTEIPAPATGTVLKIVAQEGVPAKVGELLAIIGQPGEEVSGVSVSSVRSVEEALPQVKANLTPDTSHLKQDLGFISPVVARVAAEHGVDLSQVNGTGLNGRITKNDILGYVESKGSSRIAPSGRASSHTKSVIDNESLAGGDQLIKHSTIRKQIAAHMVESKHTSPHVLTVMEADMSKVAKHRAANKAAFERDGVNLTFTAYFMMAIVAGLKAYPQTNSSWTDEGLLVHKNINLGMAVSLGEEGLIVPVIKNADNLSLLAMARTVNDLATRSRNKKLQPDEVKGGTFTLTNHGVSGSLFAFPVINQPQAGILGVGALQKRVVVIDDAIAIRPMVYLSFVFDHRILDGASADWFLAKVKETLESWG